MEIYAKGGTENTCIMAVREALIQRFQATDWLDLRVGFLLSIEKATGPHDVIAAIQEDIGADDRTFLPWTDRFQIGLTDHDTLSTFSGYTNAPVGRVSPGMGRSRLLSSDAGVGTSNTNFWRPTNGANNKFTAQIIQNDITRAQVTLGSQPHFAQSTGGAGGYATLLMLRFTRADARGRSKIITMEVKKAASGDSSDILFTNDPSALVLETGLESLPATTQRLGPVELSHEPDTFFLYWPFTGSRLRIHAMGILKQA